MVKADVRRCPDCGWEMDFIGTRTSQDVFDTGTEFSCPMCDKTWMRLRKGTLDQTKHKEESQEIQEAHG